MNKLNWKPEKFIRQGDVKVQMISVIPEGNRKDIKENNIAVLAHGEVTGHKHQIKEGIVNFFTIENMFDHKYLEVLSDTAILEHEEHTEIVLNKGLYEVTIQREYTPEEIRNVLD